MKLKCLNETMAIRWQAKFWGSLNWRFHLFNAYPKEKLLQLSTTFSQEDSHKFFKDPDKKKKINFFEAHMYECTKKNCMLVIQLLNVMRIKCKLVLHTLLLSSSWKTSMALHAYILLQKGLSHPVCWTCSLSGDLTQLGTDYMVPMKFNTLWGI